MPDFSRCVFHSKSRWTCFALAFFLCVSIGSAMAQLSTEDHLADPGFWPTQDNPTREAFAGPEACSRCHAALAKSQKETPMAGTAMPAAAAAILHGHPDMTFHVKEFNYRMETTSTQSVYSVTRGNEKLSFPLTWAFGTPRVAQSYLFKKDDGNFYESRATYFVSLGGLDFTPSRALASPASVQEAMYRQVPPSEVKRCFACHATASTIEGNFDEKHMIPGVTCEACHGPGTAHVKAMDDLLNGRPSTGKRQILNSAHLAPADAVDFCGACHGSWWDVKLSGIRGVSTARSAPYRLVTSKCWGKGDARLTCTACHDPHQQLETNAAAYDHQCLTCHGNAPGVNPTADHPGKACPTATKNCTSCHMQKVTVPEMHADFTDHRIRIVKPSEAFPD